MRNNCRITTYISTPSWTSYDKVRLVYFLDCKQNISQKNTTQFHQVDTYTDSALLSSLPLCLAGVDKTLCELNSNCSHSEAFKLCETGCDDLVHKHQMVGVYKWEHMPEIFGFQGKHLRNTRQKRKVACHTYSYFKAQAKVITIVKVPLMTRRSCYQRGVYSQQPQPSDTDNFDHEVSCQIYESTLASCVCTSDTLTGFQ